MSNNKVISAHPLNRQTPIITTTLFLFLTILYVVPNLISVHLSLKSIEQILPNMIWIVVVIYFAGINLHKLWKNEKVTLYDNGIEYSTRQSKQFWHWYEIDDIRSFGRGLSRTAQLSLHASQKTVLKIDDRFHSSATLGENVLQQLYKLMDYQVAFDAGDTISTGDIHVNRKGIQIKQDLLSWGQVRAIRRDQFRAVQIDRQNDESLTLNIKNIPNAPLLVQFITNHVQELVANDDPESLTVKPDLSLDAGLNRGAIWFNIAKYVLIIGLFIGLPVYMNNFASPKVTTPLWIIALFACGGLFLLSMIVKQLLILRSNDTLTVNDKGILHTWRGGASNWKWEEFTRADVLDTYTFWIDDDVVLTIGNRYLRYGDLGLAALDKVANHLHLKYKEAFDNGDMLNFGAIQMDSSMIRFNGKEFAWDDISRASEWLDGGGFEYALFDVNQEVLAKVLISTVENFNTATRFINEKLLQFGMGDQ